MSWIRRRTTSRLSSFMFGIPYISRPPGRSALSNTVTEWPARLSCTAAERPAGPEPMTATFLPVRTAGASGTTQPSSHPRSMIEASMFLIVTGGVVEPEYARAFAGRGTDTSGELREIIRLVKPFQRLAPAPAIDEVVPLRDDVVDRAARRHAADELARVAERNSAIHAPRALVAELLLLHVVVEFLPVADALKRRPVHGKLPQILNESSWFAHCSSSVGLSGWLER